MTEREIQFLGFEKNWIDDPIDSEYYYSLRLTPGLSFISQSSGTVSDDNWFADIFNTQNPIRFYQFSELKSLINLLNSRMIIEESGPV
jgi:hypothetical protein